MQVGLPRWFSGKEFRLTMQGTPETQSWSLDLEGPLEEERAPTPVFLPGESPGQRSLKDYSPLGLKESDVTEHACILFMQICTDYRGLPGGSDDKGSPCNAGDTGFEPWVRKIPWRREWLPTLVFMPGESHGHQSIEGYWPWGPKESYVTKQLTHTDYHLQFY